MFWWNPGLHSGNISSLILYFVTKSITPPGKINRIFSTSHHHTFMCICIEKKITLHDRLWLTFSLLETELCLPLLTTRSSSLFWSLPGETQAFVTTFARPLLHNTCSPVLDCKVLHRVSLKCCLLTQLGGRKQGHTPHPKSVPTAGSSALRTKRMCPTAPSSCAQACCRAQGHCRRPPESLTHPHASDAT